jgi:Retroviral aspartyl protease
MRFKEKIGKRDIYALLDSGSTRSFINPMVLQGIDCKITVAAPIVVMMATGTKMVTDSRCEGLLYSLQGFQFCENMRILDIKGYDVIHGN